MEKMNVAVDLGGTQVRVALADRSLELHHKIVESTDHSHSASGVIDQIVRMAEEALTRSGLAWQHIERLAVASPGPLDARSGLVFAPPNMPGWGDVPLGPELAARTGVPVAVVNDANAAGFGEFHFGAGRGLRNLVYLTISTGIGGGVVVDGALLGGSAGTAAEIGHHTIDLHGVPCKCGSVGCLEMLASGTSIARLFQEALDAGEVSLLRPEPGSPVSAADVASAAGAGDPLAARIFRQAAEALGFGIVNCIHIFNPDIVVLGGGVTHAGKLLFDPVREIVDRHTMPVQRAAVRIVPAELGEDVGLIGAAAVAANPAATVMP